ADVAPDVGSDAAIEQTGLVGYWKFDETTGTSAFDTSSSENTGTLTNGAAFAAVHLPNPLFTDTGAVSLDGTNDYVSFGTTGIPKTNAVQTISLWVNVPTPVAGGVHDFFSEASPNATTGCGLQIGLRNGNFAVWLWGAVGGALVTKPAA